MTDRLYGCAVGAAVGDALGMPLEFLPPVSPQATVRKMIRGRLPAGCFTDDTEMALALAESLLEQRPLDGNKLVSHFVDWFSKGPSDVGSHTSVVMGWLMAGIDWQPGIARIQQEMPASSGNGSVMRCWPVALAWWQNREQLVIDSELQSIVTHPHPDCRAASVFVNWMIAELVAGATPNEAFASAIKSVPLSDEFYQVVVSAAQARRENLKNSGWVRHTLESALWGLLTTQAFEEAVVRVVNLGNDADTAGSVVGALAGAAYGLEAIPYAWRRQLQGEWPLHSGYIWQERHFITLVDRLSRA
ncbi:MAG TPA: ADP-ribosylglycohydrolase family protein [Levilinea sp.]|nr:ADP-ribosylglycohydrolase family protein [Levilinea sp.]